MLVTFNEVADSVQKLNLKQKKHLKDLTEKMIIEERREEILRNAAEAMQEHREGKLKSYDNVDDLMKALNAD